MEPTEPITIRASKDVINQIDTLAAGMDRSRNYVINQVIQQYLAYHYVLHQKIEQGLNDIKEGRLTTADDVMKDIRSHRARRRT
jgi:predicted transcriptional regulator